MSLISKTWRLRRREQSGRKILVAGQRRLDALALSQLQGAVGMCYRKLEMNPRMKVSNQFTRNIQPLIALSSHSIVLGSRVISESLVPLLAECESPNGSGLAIPADLRQLSRQTKRMFSCKNALFRIQRHEIASGSHCMDLHFLATGQQRKRLPSRDTAMSLSLFAANSLESLRGREPFTSVYANCREAH